MGAEATALQTLFRERIAGPSLALLRESAASDRELTDLLARVSLAVSSTELEPLATAYESRSGPCIQVDVGYVARDRLYLDLAAYQALRHSWGPLAEERLASLSPQSIDGWEQGVEFPSEIPEMMREAHRVLRWTITFDVVIWTTLHEMGHHALGHGAPPGDLSVARQEELEADAWAFDQMRRLGMPLCYVFRYMEAREIAESRWLELGLIEEEERRRHPSFHRRAEELAQRAISDSVPSSTLRAAHVALPRGTVLTFVVDFAQEEGVPFMTATGGFNSDLQMVGIREGRTFRYLIDRADDRLLEVRLTEFDRCSVRAAFHLSGPGIAEESPAPAWQFGIRTYETWMMPDLGAEGRTLLSSAGREQFLARFARELVVRTGRPADMGDELGLILVSLLRIAAHSRYAQLAGRPASAELGVEMLAVMQRLRVMAQRDPALMDEVFEHPVLQQMDAISSMAPGSPERRRAAARLLLPELEAAMNEER